EDSEKPPSPSAAAAHSAEQAALYAWDAHQYASRIMGIFADAILKALPSEHDKVDQISELLADASDAAGLAQAAADQAAGAAAEASASPDTAEFNAGIAAADATEALDNRYIAEGDYETAMLVRGDLTEFRLWGDGPAPGPEG